MSGFWIEMLKIGAFSCTEMSKGYLVSVRYQEMFQAKLTNCNFNFYD